LDEIFEKSCQHGLFQALPNLGAPWLAGRINGKPTLPIVGSRAVEALLRGNSRWAGEERQAGRRKSFEM
jgi:hypothetical protein